ncbi:MAG: VCBS repeat-containing protein [Acidobacteriota bacterium]|nr:VCBS repeat-containing protein [Acidobacteriota bacterium]
MELPETSLRQSAARNKDEVSKSGLFKYLKSRWWTAAIIALIAIGATGASLKYLEEDAKKQLAARAANKGQFAGNREQSFLSSINPFLPAAAPNPTPQIAKEYIYAGSRLLAVEDAGASAAPPADLAVWRPSTGYWHVMGLISQQWGSSAAGDKPVPGDYDGDGKTDFCVFRASAATWFIIKSSSNAEEYYYFGTSGDIPLAADFDGDGKSDAAVYHSSGGYGTWQIRKSTTNTVVSQQFGLSYPTDAPTPADFDGDGKADIGVWRDSGTFYSLNSSNNQLRAESFGIADDKPLPADYDGDGRADVAVWRGSNNNWYIRQSSDSQLVNYQFGNRTTDKPVPNDYDGDGKVDIAVWRDTNGYWYIRQSSRAGQPDELRQVQWGQTGDLPVPIFYRR